MYDKKIYTNVPISDKLFEKIDKNNSGQIEFVEFMDFFILIFKGSQKDKALFIFKFIADRRRNYFGLDDLVMFYELLNKNYKSNQQNQNQDESNQVHEC